MPFQKTANLYSAPGLPGDFATANPYASSVALEGAFVAGANGVTVGAFAWADSQQKTVSNSGSGAPDGIVLRAGNFVLITAYLGETSNLILAGFETTLVKAGDIWLLNSGTNTTAKNQKVYANYANGLATTGATGTPPSGASATGVIAAAPSTTFTGAIAAPPVGSSTGSILTVSTTPSSPIVLGGAISGTGVVSGQKIVSQLTGTAGGQGTYLVAIPQAAATATTVTETYGVLTISGSVTGSFGVGEVLSGTGVDAGTTIISLGTGTGGAGTYNVSSATAVSSTTISGTGGVETAWYCQTVAAPGEVFIASRTPND